MRHKRVVVFGVILLSAIAATVWFASRRDPLNASVRREWKDTAVRQLRGQIQDQPRIQQAINVSKTSSEGWVGEDLIVLKSGEWIACRSICRKQNAAIHDLFIGHGSDGKWYYSTFHFCVGKCALLFVARQPDTLADFVDAYWLKEFDGQSNECLNLTWTGFEPWGDEKLPPPK